jgi:putative colanic acid biosynthesis UDP-glucose lipid carrier transferase
MMPDQGKIRPYTQQLGLLFRFLDVCLIMGTLWMGTALRGIAFHFDYMVAGALGGLCFAIIGDSRGLYSTRRMELLRREIEQIWMVWACTCGVLLVAGFGIKMTAVFSRITVSTWFVAVPMVLSLWRVLMRFGLRALRKRGKGPQHEKGRDCRGRRPWQALGPRDPKQTGTGDHHQRIFR